MSPTALSDDLALSDRDDTDSVYPLPVAEHLTAEYRVKTEGRGRTVDEWKIRAERSENHWFDGLVGCAVAASMQGVVLPGTESPPAPKRPRLRLSELQGRRR